MESRAYNSGSSELAVVQTYKPWLQEQSNQIATRAGKRKRFPNVNPLPSDNGEQFLYEYFLAQLEREKEPGWNLHVDTKREWFYCPCGKCTLMRQTCKCAVCAKIIMHQAGLQA